MFTQIVQLTYSDDSVAEDGPPHFHTGISEDKNKRNQTQIQVKKNIQPFLSTNAPVYEVMFLICTHSLHSYQVCLQSNNGKLFTY